MAVERDVGLGEPRRGSCGRFAGKACSWRRLRAAAVGVPPTGLR